MSVHPAGAVHLQAAPKPAVLVLHGLWNVGLWVRPLARRLSLAGFDAHVFGYQSIASLPQMDLVGHSLGGLIALEALRRHPDLPVPRLVCLGSPLRGSVIARALLQRGWGGAMGLSGPLLEQGCQAWRGATEVGIVAGDVPRGVGRLLGRMGLDSDGVVALSETRLAGLTDHCCVHASHTGLAFSPLAAGQVAAFLRDGRFQR